MICKPDICYPHRAPGYPERSPDLDALPGFKNPPPGYGEVPFWWWTGEDLDVERMLAQVRALHEKGISGVQVNYSHTDSPGWPTDSGEPALFTDAWWKVYARISQECVKYNMGIGLSTYTLDWPNGAENLFYRLFYSKPELNALELIVGERRRLTEGARCQLSGIRHCAAHAYEVKGGILQVGGVDLAAETAGQAESIWTAPAGEWEVWIFQAVRREGTLNPLMRGAGETVVQKFFQPFQDHNPGKTAEGLNYFFNDELKIGLGKYAWNSDFEDEFHRRKGYDLLEVLPAMWIDMGDITPKVRIDYADVRMSLMEERYFEPIYNWHAERGIIFGCDNDGRGLDPHAYGDYYRATRWYTAPGHDTPGGMADLIKGKVSSSIANLYGLPRVQLEGYHSLGWGATTERIMEATCQNYLYGCNLLSLHGCYYTTHGSRWEWAPPCYHFRMPYWNHMGTFLKYFERLSYLMSQGHHVCDVAVIYPVTPFEAEMHGDQARDAAFEIGRELMAAGINFDYIDHQSLARAVVQGETLCIHNVDAREPQATNPELAYRVLVVPNMQAVRWSSIEKAAEFAANGGLVLAVGALPRASDRAGSNDAELIANNDRAFAADRRYRNAHEAVDRIRHAMVQDVRGLSAAVLAQHRKIGTRDVYMVMGATPGNVIEFRVKGRVELWNPWTGDVRPLHVVAETATGTQVELPLEKYEAQIVVFTPEKLHSQEGGSKGCGGAQTEVARRLPATIKDLTGNQWRVSFEPTMDNRYGDFRWPVTPENGVIGVEARRFAWTRETAAIAESAMLPETDDSSWPVQLHGYGPQFFLLGPVSAGMDTAALDAKLATYDGIDPSVPVKIAGQTLPWRAYEFSWRYGKGNDSGHQGFHGQKGSISDNFIRLGHVRSRPATGISLEPEEDQRYYLWTTVSVAQPTDAMILVSKPAAAGINASPVNTPAALFIDGQRIADLSRALSLAPGTHTILLRYDDHGESHFVLRRRDVPQPERREKLAMTWYNDPGVIPFDPYAGETAAEWFRFLSAPGTTAIQLRTPHGEKVQAWIHGTPMIATGNGRFVAQTPRETAAVVALRLWSAPGRSGGAAITEPITIETSGSGIMPLGDWAKLGVLNNYSGGVRYRTTFGLAPGEAEGRIQLDLGQVIATAEVSVNGRNAGVRVAPPWTFDLSGLLQTGENDLEVLIYNTLSNHYQTIPSQYCGDPASGLIGPVQILKAWN